MTSKHADWFETSVKYDKMGDAGTPVTVKETYSLESFTFTIAEELKVYISGEFDVVDMKKAPYKEVFFSENPADDKWYKVKAQFIIIDEKTEKEKYSTVTYLVQSNSLQNAVKGICEVLDKGMQDWKLSSITETKLLDVFEKKPA